MKAQINITMDNAAFAEDGNEGRTELARILRDLADNLEAGNGPGESVSLRDGNGNRVGCFDITEKTMKRNPISETLTEAEETRRGENLVKLMGLKPTRQTDSQNRPFNPPRYETAWGTKTVLGLFRSVAATVEGVE